MKTVVSFPTDTTAALPRLRHCPACPFPSSLLPHKNFLHAQSDGLKVFAPSRRILYQLYNDGLKHTAWRGAAERGVRTSEHCGATGQTRRGSKGIPSWPGHPVMQRCCHSM